MCEAAMGLINAKICSMQNEFSERVWGETRMVDARCQHVVLLLEIIDAQADEECRLNLGEVADGPDTGDNNNLANNDENPACGQPRRDSRPCTHGAARSEAQENFGLLTCSSASPASPADVGHYDEASFTCNAEDLAAARSVWVKCSKEKAKLSEGRMMHAWSYDAVTETCPMQHPLMLVRAIAARKRQGPGGMICRHWPVRDFSPQLLKRAL
jgi:hypothetical protein